MSISNNNPSASASLIDLHNSVLYTTLNKGLVGWLEVSDVLARLAEKYGAKLEANLNPNNNNEPSLKATAFNSLVKIVAKTLPPEHINTLNHLRGYVAAHPDILDKHRQKTPLTFTFKVSSASTFGKEDHIRLYVANHIGQLVYSTSLARSEVVTTTYSVNLAPGEQNFPLTVRIQRDHQLVGVGSVNIEAKKLKSSDCAIVPINIYNLEKKDVGTLNLDVTWKDTQAKNSNEYEYDTVDGLPVLSLESPFPPEQGTLAWILQNMLIDITILALIAAFDKLEKEEQVWKVVPQRLPARTSWAGTNEWFVDRRINGFNPGFLQKSNTAEYDYFIEWDFSYMEFGDKYWRYKDSIIFPKNVSARFKLSPDGTALNAHSIQYTLLNPDTPETHVVTPKDNGWEFAKKVYLTAEVNINYTWTHVGVHFTVEEYAMAVYRNLSTENPVYKVLLPHFRDIMVTNRMVVRPKPEEDGGVVTIAGVLTYDGQVKMLQERFKGLKWRGFKPFDLLPSTLSTDLRRNQETGKVFWEAITEYIEGYFTDKRQAEIKSLWKEIDAMSEDLAAHSLIDNKDEMKIRSMDDLKQVCIYVIWQAIFNHDWIHWPAWDDFYPSLIIDPAKNSQAAELERRSRGTELAVTFVSANMKQWPVLDPEFGGPKELQNAIRKRISQLNQREMLVGSYILGPTI